MRQWLDAGYFKGDLPISQSPTGPFKSLSSLFPDSAIAFKPTEQSVEQLKSASIVPKEDVTEEMNDDTEVTHAASEVNEQKSDMDISQIEENRLNIDSWDDNEREGVEKEEIVEAQFQNDSTMQVQSPVENDVQVNTDVQANESNNQSKQLKMLLGLGAMISTESSNNSSTNESVTIAGPPSPNEKKSSISSTQLPTQQQLPDIKPQIKASKSKPLKTDNTQQEDSPSMLEEPKAATKPNVSSTPSPAWGGAGAGKSLGRQKSMSEIQEEEKKVAVRLAKQRDTMPRNSGGWANIAKSGGTTAWSGSAVMSKSGSSTQISSTTSTPSSTGNSNVQQERAKQQSLANLSQKKVTGKKQSSNTQKTMEEFGANEKMSPSLENWCKDQMRKLNGSEDLTLVAFCMTLSDAVEIRQYLTAYLGTNPQVNTFATEFINRKNGGNKLQEQWETTVNNKKGRKKKGSVPK